MQIRSIGFEADFAYGPPDVYQAASHVPRVGRLYVDRFGQEREDTMFEGLPSINLWAAGKCYDLDPIGKRILSENKIGQRETLEMFLPGVLIFSLPRYSLSGRAIGTRQIEGLTCKGAVSEGTSHGKMPQYAIECWHAEQISYIVAANATWTLADGQKVETTFRLTKIQLRDPDPELFKVPTDYTPVPLVPVKR